MKEMEFMPNQGELTGKFNPSTLDVRGDIFMPDGPGNLNQEPPIGRDITPSEKPKIKLKKQPAHPKESLRVSPQEAEERWRTHYKEQGIDLDKLPDPDENMAVRMAISEGRVPDSSPEEIVRAFEKLIQSPEDKQRAEEVKRRIGESVVSTAMADIIDPATYPAGPLQNNAAEFMAEVTAASRRNESLDSNYIKEIRAGIRNLRDAGGVDATEANRLIDQINSWMEEADSGGRYFSAKDEKGILTNNEERERVFEEIFVGVDANPGSDFRSALSLEAGSKLDYFFTLLSHAKVYDDTGVEITNDPSRTAEVSRVRNQLFSEYSGKREIRRILHDANWSVSGGGDIQAFATAMATFQSEYIDLIFEDPLVSTALHMFEQAFQQIKADNNGKLPYEELAYDYKKKSSKLEDKVWDLMRTQIPDGIPEWRIRRSIILARGFGVASLRFPEIAAQARLEEETPLSTAEEKASRFGSIYGEAIARYLDPLEHLIEKFHIGEKDRALLYFFLTGDKAKIQSRKQLEEALEMESQLEGKDKRLIDIINIFRIGGGFSQSSWRSFMAQRDLPDEQRRRAGIGIREGRVSGDVDDDIIAEVRRDLEGRSEHEMEEEIKKRKKDDKVYKKEKKRRENDKRLEMWQDTLKTNPLRVMWQWEEKEHGVRYRFLSEVLGISEDDAKTLLPTIEKDLMIIQENTVQALSRGDITYDDPEMLEYSLIGGGNPTPEELTRRENVRRYVEKIRDEASAPNDKGENHGFIRSMFDKTPAEKSPFPFVIGFEDIPFSEFDFINTGGRGFARRINDYAASVQASNELMGLIEKLPVSNNIEPIIESLVNIKKAISQYDKSIAMEVVPFIAEGIIRFYDKDWQARLPFGIGSAVDLLTDSSFAQTLYGREAMTWDEGDKYNFTRHIMLKNLAEKERVKEMRRKVGATNLNVGIDITRTYGQLLLFLLAYEFVKEVTAGQKQ